MACRQNPNLELSLARRVVIFMIGVVESMLFGGAVFGWPQLVHVLKVEGLYSDLCMEAPSAPNHTRRPPSAADTFNNTRCLNLNTTFEISDSKAIGVEKCDPQDERFALIYTVTVCCYSIPGILVGYLLHHAGLRVTRVSGGTMLSLGFLFLGIATKVIKNGDIFGELVISRTMVYRKRRAARTRKIHREYTESSIAEGN